MNNRAEAKGLGKMIESLTDGRVGLTTYSPGDGVTRYALGEVGSLDDGFHDYFGDRQLCYAEGAASAVVMCRAFLAGRSDTRRNGA